MHKIKDMLMEELYEYEEKAKKGQGKMSAGDLETLHKLTDTIKNIDKIEMLEDVGNSENGGDWMARGMYDGSYGDEEHSYARRKRDSRGRYSRDGGSYDGGSSYNRGGYSRDGGKDRMIEKLEQMMREASNDKEREAFRHFIDKLDTM